MGLTPSSCKMIAKRPGSFQLEGLKWEHRNQEYPN